MARTVKRDFGRIPRFRRDARPRRTFGPCWAGREKLARNANQREKATRGGEGATTGHLSRRGYLLPPIGIHEAGVLAFADVADDRSVQRLRRRLLTRADPIALGLHGIHR